MTNNSKKLTEYKLSELVLAIFNHPKTPKWLCGGLWDVINDHSYMDAFDPDYIKLMIKEADLDSGGENDNEK